MTRITSDDLAAIINCTYPMMMPSCEHTMASTFNVRYQSWRAGYLVAGACTTAACIYQLFRVFSRAGSSLQKCVYPLLLISSLTFIVRGVDPNSYGNQMPLLVSTVSGAICNCALYSLCYGITIIWAGLLQSYGTNIYRGNIALVAINVVVVILTWSALIVGGALAGFPEFVFAASTYAILNLILIFCGVLGNLALIVTGVRLHRKLRDIIPRAAMGSSLDPRRRLASTISLPERVDSSQCFIVRCFKTAYHRIMVKTNRVMTILYVLSVLSVCVVGLQIVNVITLLSPGNVNELNAWQKFNLCEALTSTLSSSASDGPWNEDTSLANQESSVQKLALLSALRCGESGSTPQFEQEMYTILQFCVLLLHSLIFWRVKRQSSPVDCQEVSSSSTVSSKEEEVNEEAVKHSRYCRQLRHTTMSSKSTNNSYLDTNNSGNHNYILTADTDDSKLVAAMGLDGSSELSYCCSGRGEDNRATTRSIALRKTMPSVFSCSSDGMNSLGSRDGNRKWEEFIVEEADSFPMSTYTGEGYFFSDDNLISSLENPSVPQSSHNRYILQSSLRTNFHKHSPRK